MPILLQSSRENLTQSITKFAQPNYQKAIWQISNTFVPYLGLWALMIFSVLNEFPYWVTLLLSVVATGFLVRIFILLHDCCHYSFFRSRPASQPASQPNFRLHRWHHGPSGNIDRRGVGDMWTLTVNEYLSASKLKHFAYRSFRNPLILFRGNRRIWKK